MRLGSRAFVERAAERFRRQGGNVIHRSPYVVSAAMQFDARLAAMPDYFRRTELLYEAPRAHPAMRVNPGKPAANMRHLHLPVSRERGLDIRTELAEGHGIWLFSRISHGVLPDTSSFELYLGDNLLQASEARLREALAILATKLK